MQKIYLICGVPGSGKSWVASQLPEYNYLSNDVYHHESYANVLAHNAVVGSEPVLADCPFGERLFREELLSHNLEVEPVFIVEPAHIVKERYEAREGRPCPKNVLTRAKTIEERADEWNAYKGTSEQVLEYLKSRVKQ